MINKDCVAARFKKAQTTYDEHAVVQTQMAWHLSRALLLYSGCASFPQVLEIGCGTGIATRALHAHIASEHIYLNDFEALGVNLATDTELYVSAASGILLSPLWGDIECLAMPNGLDLVFSSSVFQWLNQPAELLQKIKMALNPDGLLVFSVFGPNNMQEVKTLTGLGLDYLSLTDWQGLLQDDFEILLLEEEKINLGFATPKAVLQHIKATGVNGVNRGHWGRAQYQQFCQAYREHFLSPDKQSVSLSYHPIYCVAKKKK